MEPVLESEIEKAVSKLNSGIAPDIDGISGEHFKYSKKEMPVLIDTIDSIFNILDVQAFLKCGILTPIHKNGKDNFLTNSYRGIVVSNIFARILESILKNR